MRGRLVGLLLACSLMGAGCHSDDQLGEFAPKGQPTTVISGVAVFIRSDAAHLAEQHQLDLQELLRPVVGRAAELLHSPKTSVVIQVKAASAIYEVAVGGRTDPRRGSIVISLADVPDVAKEQRALTVWLPATVAHEMNHSARILDGPGYGTMLRDVMISEGLADQFASALLPGTPTAPWTDALTAAQVAGLWRRAQPLLDKSSLATNREWLFGSDAVPRWTAYTLGSQIVAAYRAEQSDASWRRLTRLDSKAILEGAHYDPVGRP